MADEIDPITGQRVVRVPGQAGAVSLESVGDTRFVYDDTPDKPKTETVDDKNLANSVASAFAQVLGATPAAAATLPPPGQATTEDTAGEYANRMNARDDAALDAEEAELRRQVAVADVADAVKGVAGDVAKGLFVEGVPAAIGGAKKAVNETLDLIDSTADKIETVVPGTVVWSGLDGDPNTPFKVELTTEEKSKARGFPGFDKFRFKIGKAEEAPTTVTGNFVQKAAQFATGMAGAGKVLKGWTAATRAATVGKALASGAIADFAAFDPHEERLSNFLQEMSPDAAKPLFEYLAADENDSEFAGRAKNALEGAGLGLAAEGVMKGLRAIKAARTAKRLATDAAKAEGFQTIDDGLAAAAGEQGATVEADVAKLLNRKPKFEAKVEAASVDTRKLPKGVAADLTAPPPGDNPFNIKFGDIESPDDVKALIGRMTKKLEKQGDAARRGERTWQQTGEAADQLDWVQSMASRRSGDAANAETILAYREALNASGAKLLDLATEVQAKPGDIATQFAFRRSLAVHAAIQAEFLGARAEAGRALNAFRIPAGTPAQKLRQIDALLADSGGRSTTTELAKKIAQAAKNGDVALNQMVRQGWGARTRDMVGTVYTNGLLSGLGTPAANIAGNTIAVFQNVLARAAAPRLAGADSVTEIGEAAHFLAGYMGAMRDAFRLAPKQALERVTMDAAREKGGLRALAPGLDDITPEALVRPAREEAGGSAKPFSAAAWRVDEDTTLGRALDVMQMVIEAPSNANQLGDDFFRALSARGELRAQAFRLTQKEIRDGVIPAEASKARMADLIENPTDDMLKAAEREMQDLTFTRDHGDLVNSLGKIRNALNDAPGALGWMPWGTILMPFLRTPANIISTAMRYSPLAPFMKRFGADIAEGGARAEIARAQMAVGTAMWALLYDAAANGDITGGGPANIEQRNALSRESPEGGAIWQPYSIRVQNPDGTERWVSYERLDPFGSAASLVADYSELVNNNDWDDAQQQQLTEIAGHGVGALGQAFFNKTMLKSTFQTVEALTQKDTAAAEQMLKGQAAGLIPFSSAARMFRRGDDEYMRATSGVLDAMKNAVPGLSKDLPVDRDLWGTPKTYETGLGVVYDAIAPVKTKKSGGSAIDLDIIDNGVGVRMPSKSFNVPGAGVVSLKNRLDIYNEFVRLAGEPAFAKLNAVAEGTDADSDYYLELSGGPDGGKAEYIKDVIEAYRRQARAVILQKYADELQQMAAESKMRRTETRQ